MRNSTQLWKKGGGNTAARLRWHHKRYDEFLFFLNISLVFLNKQFSNTIFAYIQFNYLVYLVIVFV